MSLESWELVERPPMPARDPGGHKGTFGTVGVIGGQSGEEVMVGGKLAWRDGGKPSDAKGGYDLGCQQLACHVGWPGPAPPLMLKFTSEIATSSVTTGFPNI